MTPISEADQAGIFGGTFDPIHRGHVAVAEQAADILDLPTMLLVPAGVPPHRAAPAAGAGDRLAMVDIAVAGHPRLRASDIEVARPGPSFAIDTVRKLRQEAPDRRWFLLLGWDAAREFGTWKHASEIVSLLDVVVFNRSGESQPSADGLRAAGLPVETRLLTVYSPAVSGDEIRARLAAGADVGSELDPGVLDYIKAHGLYTA